MTVSWKENPWAAWMSVGSWRTALNSPYKNPKFGWFKITNDQFTGWNWYQQNLQDTHWHMHTVLWKGTGLRKESLLDLRLSSCFSKHALTKTWICSRATQNESMGPSRFCKRWPCNIPKTSNIQRANHRVELRKNHHSVWVCQWRIPKSSLLYWGAFSHPKKLCIYDSSQPIIPDAESNPTTAHPITGESLPAVAPRAGCVGPSYHPPSNDVSTINPTVIGWTNYWWLTIYQWVGLSTPP